MALRQAGAVRIRRKRDHKSAPRPENPFQQPKANFFSILRSFCPSLPLSFSSSLECRTHSAQCSCYRVAPHFSAFNGTRPLGFSLDRPVVSRTRSLGFKLQFCAFLHRLFAVNHLSLYMGTSYSSPSPSAAADLSGSGLARVVGVTSLPKWRTTVTSNDATCVRPCGRGCASPEGHHPDAPERALWSEKGRR